MPITGLQLITVTGKYLDLDGTAAAGTITFTASTVLTNTAANEIVYPVTFTVTLSGTGTFSVQLPSTNDPDLTPIGWVYTVEEDIIGANTKRKFSIQLPFDLAGATVDMADISPVFPVTEVTNYALVSHSHDTLYSKVITLSAMGGVADAFQIFSPTMTAGSFLLNAPAGSALLSKAKVGMHIIVGGAVNTNTGLRSTVAEVVSDTQLRLANSATVNTANIADPNVIIVATLGTNASPAMQAALDLAGNYGGEIEVDGRYMLATAVTRNAASPYTGGPNLLIKGKAGGSCLYIGMSTSGQIALNLTNYNHLTFRNLLFIGTPYNKTDAFFSIRVTGARIFHIDDCYFIGLSTHETNAGVIWVHSSNLKVNDTRFGGCGGDDVANSSVIRCEEWSGVQMDNVAFIDFAIWDGKNYAKSGLLGVAESWIHILNPAKSDDAGAYISGTYGQGTIRLNSLSLDEGALNGVLISSATHRISNVAINDLRMNVGYMAGASGITINNTKYVEIENSFLGYRGSGVGGNVPGVKLTNAGTVDIRKTLFRSDATLITANAATTEVRLWDVDGANTAGVLCPLITNVMTDFGRMERVEYVTPGTYTWTKPTWSKINSPEAIGGGGGGGSGRRGAAASIRCGGGGGSGAAWARATFSALVVPATMDVVVGAGGAGGAAVTVNDTNGNAGATGGTSSWLATGYTGSGTTPALRSRGGGGGGGGTNATGTAGAIASFAMFPGGAGGAATTTGGASAMAPNAAFASGGGPGGGITTADAVTAGGAGGASDVLLRFGGAGGAAGANGTAGFAPLTSVGTGGGGGGSSITGVGGTGGAGGAAGGGGGGGGASLNGNNSGAGGAGGAGAVIVTSEG